MSRSGTPLHPGAPTQRGALAAWVGLLASERDHQRVRVHNCPAWVPDFPDFIQYVQPLIDESDMNNVNVQRMINMASQSLIADVVDALIGQYQQSYPMEMEVLEVAFSSGDFATVQACFPDNVPLNLNTFDSTLSQLGTISGGALHTPSCGDHGCCFPSNKESAGSSNGCDCDCVFCVMERACCG